MRYTQTNCQNITEGTLSALISHNHDHSVLFFKSMLIHMLVTKHHFEIKKTNKQKTAKKQNKKNAQTVFVLPGFHTTDILCYDNTLTLYNQPLRSTGDLRVINLHSRSHKTHLDGRREGRMA